MSVNLTFLLVAAVNLLAMSQCAAEEMARVRFELTVARQWVNKESDPQAATELERATSSKDAAPNDYVPCSDAAVVGLVPGRLRKHKSEVVQRWLKDIGKPLPPRDHSFRIKNGNFSPRLMIIRTGDSIVQTRESGPLRFRGMLYNQQSTIFPRPGWKNPFERREPAPVSVSSLDLGRRNPELELRKAYLLIVEHTCTGISSDTGIVELSGLPVGVKIPMRAVYPWQPLNRLTFESSTLEFSKTGFFYLRCDKPQGNTHHIRIMPKVPTEHR